MKVSDTFRSFNSLFVLLTFVIFFSGTIIVSATEPRPEPRGQEGQSEERAEDAVGLPHWGEGEFREGFDGRIWPERIIRWLEQENLRDLIGDPRTPGPEKEALKRILAMQRAWPRQN